MLPTSQVAPGLAALRRDAASSFGGRPSAVEVPGQYSQYGAASAQTPRPQLHATLLRFGTVLHVGYSHATGVRPSLGR
jgi:hypothetical protein